MIKKRFKKLTSCVMAGSIITSLIGPTNVFAQDMNQNVQAITNSENQAQVKVKERTSVHDPSIVKDGDTYYVFGSHIEAAKSTDLQNWTKFTNNYTTPNNVLFGDLSKNLAGSFAWAGENDSDSKGGFSVWAPNVFWNADYVNDNGTKGAYMIYYCTSSTYKRSAIGYAVSQNIEGPYTYVDTIMYSGFTTGDSYDTGSKINTNYLNTNIKELIDNGTLTGSNSKWFTSNGAYNTSYSPNAIDPELFYDSEGTLWMTYGSWSGGVYILKVDKSTGKVIYPGKDENSDSGNITDRYFGTRISGGYTKSGEGAKVVYDKETGYYYLYVSYAGLAAKGGYNIRLFRSKSSEGPYLDAAGNNAVLPGNVDNAYSGIKLIGNYKFDCLDVGYKAAGHNSSFIDSDGQMYLVYHTRFNNGTEEHQVRVHQMFINEEGWPVVAPYEYSGDKISEDGYSKDEVVGYYQFINHGNSNSSAMIDTLNVELKEDYTVSGDVSGTWSMKDDSYFMNVTIDGVTYKGVFFKQQDESKYVSKVMTFTALGSNNECIWGSKLELKDSEAVQYAGNDLEAKIPSSTKSDITLPTVGAYNTTISWYSSNPSVLDSEGVISRTANDEIITLTAKISKGESVYNKTFNVVVKGKLEKIDLEPTYKYDFDTLNESNEVLNSGIKDGSTILVGSASILDDKNRGKVLSISNEKGAIKENYLALPSDTFSGIINKGYTIGMWVNVDTTDPNYFEHSALFEGNGGGQDKYPVTRISANLFSRINSNGAWADATEISKPLKANTWQYVTYTVNSEGIAVYVDGDEVGSAKGNLTACFADDFLSNMTDVRVGSGNIWGDADISSAKFDNVSVYDTALTDQQVEALYNEEVSSKPEEPSNPSEGNGISFNYKVDEAWENYVKSTVKLTNTSDKTISNWALKADFDGEITQIWNASIASHDGNSYIIKNSGWPQDITTGAAVEFGFIASYEGEKAPEITKYSIVSSEQRVEDDQYKVDFSKSSEWDNGFNGELVINNNGNTPIENWVIEFDYKDTIESIWNAEIVSHKGDHYVIKGKSHNANIKAENSVSFGFEGVLIEGGKSTEVPENYILSEVTY